MKYPMAIYEHWTGGFKIRVREQMIQEGDDGHPQQSVERFIFMHFPFP
jgi:hypothetical protein